MTLPTDIVAVYFMPALNLAVNRDNAQPPIKTPLLMPAKINPYLISGIASAAGQIILTSDKVSRAVTKVRKAGDLFTRV